MTQYKLKTVETEADKQAFWDLSDTINAQDTAWVRPLDADVESVFDPQKNTQFEKGEAIRWLLIDDQATIIGRIAAFWNADSAAKCEQPTGGCGFFECINSQAAADTLFDAARDWLKDRGMEAMDGPVNFGDRNMWWGLLVEGFTMPLYGCPYNPPYYQTLFENYGFCNYFNQHSYFRELKANSLNPSTYERAQRLKETPGYLFTKLDKRHLAKFAEDFRQVYNRGWAKFTGVSPLTEEHAQKLMRTMKPVIDEELMFFAYYEGEPIGFFITIPDLNKIIGSFHGKFGWWQKLQLIYKLRYTRQCDRALGMIFGVVPEFQGKGIESGLINCIEEYVRSGRGHYKTLELTWIGDFNPVMMRMIEQYVCAVKFKMHTTYRYLFDRDREFTRAPRLGRTRTRTATVANNVQPEPQTE